MPLVKDATGNDLTYKIIGAAGVECIIFSRENWS